jgi:antitoxin CptB
LNDAPGELVWRSRRGTKELDLMLSRWLERCYAHATDDEKAQFARFLDLPDPEMVAYLLQHEKPTDPAFATLVSQLAATRP